MRKFFSILFLLIVILLKGLAGDINLENEKKNLLRTDLDFLKYIEKKGIIQAFLYFMSDKGIILPLYGHPIIGKQSFQNIISKKNQTDLKKLSNLEPLLVVIASSGDLGYTHGRFQLSINNSSKDNKIEYGYCGSLWGKMPDGKWRIVFSQGLFLVRISNKKPDNFIQKKQLSEEERSLVKTELAFSKSAGDNGIANAFYRFMDDNGIVLSGSGLLLNKKSYQKLMSQKPRRGWKNKFQWKPIFTRVSDSGDLGYNFGPYEYTITNPEGENQSFFGYFITVWKKQLNGNWKFVFDGGNQVQSSDKDNQ